MSEYHIIGEPIDQDNVPAIFELRICDHLICIDPKTFELSDVPTVDPHAYFITSGDALSKAIKLEKDVSALADKLSDKELRRVHSKPKIKQGKKTCTLSN